MKKSTLLFLLLVTGLFAYFGFKGVFFLDPDYGWHIRMGQIILTHGIPATDPLSYTMPSYPFVDHEWLTNTLFSLFISYGNYAILAVLFAFLTLGAVLLSLATVRQTSRQFILLPLFLTGVTLYSFAGVRPQVISWLLFSLLLWLVRQKKYFLRWRWFFPLIFVIWVNMHGGFAVGIVTLLLACLYWAKKTALRGSLVLLFIFCLLATCINPYGYRIWWEVWMQMSDTLLRYTVKEWEPAFLSLNLVMWLFITSSTILVTKYRKKFTLFDQMLYYGLLLAGLSSLRHIPLWLLIALPLTVESLTYLSAEVSSIKDGQTRLYKMGWVLFILACLFWLPSLSTLLVVFGIVGQTSTYPEKAVSYLEKHLPEGEIFTTYSWGGYFTWKLPEKKVFIDGRMPSWRWQTANQKESSYAYLEYLQVMSGGSIFDKVVKKYTISTFVLEKFDTDDKFDSLDKYFYQKILHISLPNNRQLKDQLRTIGMKLVYQDDLVEIYQRK